MEKEYDFEVNVKIDISVVAKNEREAREQLTEQVADYFRDTDIEIGRKEATLVDVRVEKECGNCRRIATQSIGDDINRCDRCKDL